MKGKIYIIKNSINEKEYIGKTFHELHQRFNQHKRDSKRTSYENRPLYSAMKKYGVENFTISLLGIFDEEELNEKEKFFIKQRGTYGSKGYNATLGGDGKSYFNYSDKEVVDKYLELLSIRQVADYFKCDTDTISVRLKSNGIEITPGGNVKNKKRAKQNIGVNQYSLTGEYLRSFNGYSDAARWLIENNYTKSEKKHIVTNISRVCRGVESRKTAYKFIWKNIL